MGKYVIAHDLGTSGNKATLYGLDGKLIKSTVYSYGLKVGENNAAEQNADDWWKAVCETTKLLVAEVNAADIAAVSFSGQMMGCVVVDEHLAEILQKIMDKYTFENVDDSWIKMCYYYNYLGPNK